MTPPARHPMGRLYLDAWGVPDRTPTSLPVYAVCVVWVAGTDAAVEAAFAGTRSSLGLRGGYEFHARQLTKREKSLDLPRRFFEQLLTHGIEFESWCAEMVKRKTTLAPRITGKELLHKLAVQSILRMPPEKVHGCTLTYDDQTVGKKVSKGAQELRTAINGALSSDGRACALSRVIPKPAHLCAGLQLADFLAAATVEPWPNCLRVIPPGWIHHWQT